MSTATDKPTPCQNPTGTKVAYYRPELDALRFFAFVSVYCDHIDLPFRWWPAVKGMGRFGLPLFFLLSAYLIVELLLREQENTGRIDLRSFFIRRALRIWPLYFLVVLLGWIAGHVYAPARLPNSALLSMVFLWANVWLIQHGWKMFWANPLWSLSVEEQFYLVVPVTLRRFGRNPRTLRHLCYWMVGLSYTVLVIVGLRRGDPSLDIWCNSIIQFQFFAAGALIAIWGRANKFNPSGRWRVTLLLSGIALWWMAAVCGHYLTSQPLPLSRLLLNNTFALVGTAAIFWGTLGTCLSIPRPIRYLGKISFGLYVFHNIWLFIIFGTPVKNALPKVPGIMTVLPPIMTLATAAVSYRYFESPFLRLKRRFERVRTRPV